MFESGWKLTSDCTFGILTIPKRSLGGLSGRNVRLSAEWFLTSELPIELPKHIGEQLGSLMLPNVVDAGSYLVYSRSTVRAGDWTPNIADELVRAHVALLIACPFIGFDIPYCLIGRIENGVARVIRMFDGELACYSVARPRAAVPRARLFEILPIADALRILNAYPRLGRMVRTFCRACTEKDSEVRLHQFVRTAEGLVACSGSGTGQWVRRESRSSHRVHLPECGTSG